MMHATELGAEDTILDSDPPPFIINTLRILPQTPSRTAGPSAPVLSAAIPSVDWEYLLYSE